MRQRRELAFAAIILPILAVLCVGIATTLLSGAGASLPHIWAMLRGVLSPTPAGARAARHVIEGAGLVTVWCLLVGWTAGWMLGRLPPGWALAARAMLFYPALTVIIAWLLGLLVLLPLSNAANAALSASAALPPWAGSRAVLIVLLAPPFATSVAQAWRRPDAVALRAAESLGVGPVRRFTRLVGPELVWPLADAAILTFLTSAAVLAVRAAPAAAALDAAALGAVAAVLAAALLTLYVLWSLAVQRWAA